MLVEPWRINLTLEVLEGCGYNCRNCTVDKTSTLPSMSEADSRDLSNLISELEDQGCIPFEYTLGPTDLISSDNGFSWLEHPLVREFSQKFSSFVISLTLLNDDGLVELAKHIDALTKGKKFRIFTPATLKNLHNEKYIGVLRQRIAYFKSLLKEAEIYRLYMTVNMLNEGSQELRPDTIKFIKGLDLGVSVGVDLNLAHSRRGLNNLMNHLDFLKDSRLYFQTVAQIENPQERIRIIPDVQTSIELGYRNGKLYYIPVLVENFPIFDDCFEIPKPWTAEAVLAFKENLYYQNLTDFAGHRTCGDCCFLDRCARGDIHTVMRYIKEDNCLTHLKNRYDLAKFSGLSYERVQEVPRAVQPASD